MTAAVRDRQVTVFRAVVYNSCGAPLFTAQIAKYHTPKRREENRIHSSESEAEPIVEDCAFAVDVLKLTIQATDRHEASRGLSEIAELLVMSVCLLFCVCFFSFIFF